MLELGEQSEALITSKLGDQLRDRTIAIPDRVVDGFQDLLPRRWDFEDGTLQGFRHEDIAGASHPGAFHNQPTFGDNVSAARALELNDFRLPADPCAGLVLDEATTCYYDVTNHRPYLTQLHPDLVRLRAGLDQVGGDYWHAPFPIGKEGVYWIGTMDDRPSRHIAASSLPGGRAPTLRAWGSTQSDRKTGRLISPEFPVKHNWFHLLVGGGCTEEVGVYLQHRVPVISRDAVLGNGKGNLPGSIGATGSIGSIGGIGGVGGGSSGPLVRYEWQTARDNKGRKIEARGACIENMVRVAFDIRNLKDTNVRIVIEDRATGAWGHINVDDIQVTNEPPKPSSRAKDPVFGVADLHAHLMNEKAFTAYAADRRTPEASVLWGSALGPLSNMTGCNTTHTHSFDPVHGSTYTLCRDMCLRMLEGAGVGNTTLIEGLYHNTSGGYPNFTAWPMWYSAVHQQMHWSWVRRAYDGGLRTMIATVGNSEILSFSMVKEKDRSFTSDQDALALQIPAIKEFARQNASWVEVAYTPADARRIANSGKLALVIGVELDHVMDSCSADVTRENHHTARENSHPALWASAKGYELGYGGYVASAGSFHGADTRVVHYDGHPRTCTPAQIEARLAALYDQGVRHIIPMHFSDNMLGGYAVTEDLFVASAVFGSPDAAPPRLGTNEEAAGITNRLELPMLPIWVKLGPDALLDETIIEPGIARDILAFFSGGCIEDDGWRIVAGILTGGLSEGACAVREITQASMDAVRSSMPFEGATDSPAMIPIKLPVEARDRAAHVNGLGLTTDGERFIHAMKRRGMLVDLQHASEKAKNRMLEILGAYPAMASHGGVQTGATRANENVLSREQLRDVYAPPGGFAGGLVGLGTQSSRGVVQQLRTIARDDATSDEDVELQTQTRSIALGTDLNGMDWHAAPRFGHFAFPTESEEERSRRAREGNVGPKVLYQPYPASSNVLSTTQPQCNDCTWPSAPAENQTPLRPQQVVDGGQITRTFDINFDGLAHFGMIPDFLQETRVMGAEPEQMGMLFRSAEGLIRQWEESCYQAYQLPSPPAHITRGCGPRSNYE